MLLRRFTAAAAAICFACAAIICGKAIAEEECKDPRRVVGGRDTDIKQHPWQVALDLNGALCGGSIIEILEKGGWVLTAAHCFDASTKASNVRVKAGVNNFLVGGAWAEVADIKIHEKYNADTQENDLALVKLKERPAGLSIDLARPDEALQPCEDLEVTGWGRTSEGGRTSDKLQVGTVPYVINDTCNKPESYNGKIAPSLMCAGFAAGGIDSCQGDSGGPLVARREGRRPLLVGVVSWGVGCARRLKFGVYTRVSSHYDWIKRVTRPNGGQ